MRQTVLAAAIHVVVVMTAFVPAGWAGEPPSGPIVLTARQLDSVTAADNTVEVDGLATAHGPTAITSIQGSVQSEHVTVLKIDFDARRPPPAQARLQGTISLELFFAQGRATATGAADAHASVTIALSGNFGFVARDSQTTTTPTSVTQTAAAFAIALSPGN